MTRAPVDLIPGYRIERYTSPNTGGAMSGHRGPVLHIAQGTYRGTIAWQMNPNQQYADGTRVTTSSTWIIGREPGEIAEMCDQDVIAWCQRSGSRTRSSIELAGWAPQPPTAWQIEACARILAWEHRRWQVPLAVAGHDGESGLGHHSMDREWAGVEWGHDSCPGSGVINTKGAIVARAKAIVAGKDNDMPLTDADQPVIRAAVHSTQIGRTGVTFGAVMDQMRQLPGQITAMQAAVTALAESRPDVDTAAVIARMEALAAEERARDEQAAAERAQILDLLNRWQSGELTAEQVADELAARLAA